MKHLLYTIPIVIIMLFGRNATAQEWLTAGNFGTGLVFGSNDNNPLNVRTTGIQRMHINENGTTAGTPSVGTGGYIGIGADPTDIRSRLTITGENNTPGFGGNGFRDWMKTGVFNLENSDNMYVGMKEEGINRSDAIVAFGDDDADDPFNNFRILFAGNGDTDDGHLELARFTATGNIGFGPVFTNAAQPRSLLHLNRDGSNATWLQLGNATGTGMTVNDGLKIGVGTDQVGYLLQQENQPIIMQTDWNNSAGGVGGGERMRITSIGAPGVRNPANAPDDNITRVAISHDGNNPITDPVSLLHLGYDVGDVLTNDDGWRDWMDAGMFINHSNDNMYLGMKKEEGNTPLDDRLDAVVSWGDNQGPIGPSTIGPDNLRFIFTSTTGIGAGDPTSTSNNGLEVARMQPNLASTLPSTNYGMMGICNFSPGSPNDVGGLPVDAKLDIDGDLRIRQVDEQDDLTRVLVIDENDLNRVYWKEVDGGGGVGNYCPETDNPLTDNYEVPLNDFNYYFTGSQPYAGNGFNTNGLAVGLQCADDLWGKLHVVQDEVSFLNQGAPISIAGYFNNVDDDAFIGFGITSFSQGSKETINAGGYFEATNAEKENVGVQGNAFGMFGQGVTTENVGGKFSATDGHRNYGIRTTASGGAGGNIAIYAQAGPHNVGGPDWAGFFEGDVNCTGSYFNISDETLKQNVEELTGACDILAQLNPVGYEFQCQNFPYMTLPNTHQMGLLAQEVENVLPELVKDVIRPAEYDSLGNETAPQLELKAVSYVQLIPLLVAGVQEQQYRLAQQDTINRRIRNKMLQLQERVEQLENCVSEVNLCNTAQYRSGNEDDRTAQHVELKNLEAIVLDQNLPNPFAEQTTITYFIPEEIMEAELIFYDMRGRIVNRVPINERGSGKMLVFGENLKNGVYTYSLITDGKMIDTKRMLKQ